MDTLKKPCNHAATVAMASQYTERVTMRRGPSPILLVAPHAAPGDDINTDIVTEHLADVINCNAVINHGWKRGDKYDYNTETADCNNVLHMVDVVKDEFLSPILKLKKEILHKHPWCHIFFIHGMANQGKDVDVVLGYGAGSPNSFSCEPWRKNLMYQLMTNENLDVWIGKSGGNYSGWARNNMNQYFRKHLYEPKAQCMQIELVRSLRDERGVSELTAECLAAAFNDYINYDKYDRQIAVREL